jgi:hypothetical protein
MSEGTDPDDDHVEAAIQRLRGEWAGNAARDRAAWRMAYWDNVRAAWQAAWQARALALDIDAERARVEREARALAQDMADDLAGIRHKKPKPKPKRAPPAPAVRWKRKGPVTKTGPQEAGNQTTEETT